MARVICIGHAVQDYVFTLPALPTAGEKYRAQTFDAVGGGPAATAAVAITKLGGVAQLVTRLGQDAAGDAIRTELESYGVDASLAKSFPGVQSSLSSVMVSNDGERMIVNYRDDALPVDPAWLAGDDIQSAVRAADAALADVRWPQGAQVVLAAAKNARKPAILDIDGAFDADPSLFESATHLAFSADAIQSLAGTRDVLSAVQTLHQQTGVWTCATSGSDGVYACGEPFARNVATTGDAGSDTYTPYHVDAFAMTAVDTLGAGDVWHGAFALCLAEGRNERGAIHFANAAAAIKVGRAGGRKGAPTRADLVEFLKNTEQSHPNKEMAS